ncbi:MAG: response regulator [Deltaproteobacteria bacterium]|nr:response regulator [Deltaproteobacteria bacterium]
MGSDAPQVARSSLPAHQGRVLVVDDEVNLMVALCTMLTERGYEAQGVTSGAAALALLREREFDVMLCDLSMPDMDGIAVLRAISDIDANLVGIIMSGQGTVRTAVEAMQVGALDYVLKPFRMSTILPVLTRAMQMRRLRVENLQLREMVAIHELSTAMSFILDVNTVLHKAADTALQVCHADEVSLMLPTPDETELYVAVVRGKNREHLIGQRVLITAGVAGWAAQAQGPTVLEGEVKNVHFAPIFPRADIHCAISMPMLIGGRLTGVINVNATERKRQFSLGEVKALTLLASITAPALESARLHAEVREARDLLEKRVEERTAELRQTNEALRKSEELYQTLARNLPNGIVAVLDLDLRVSLIGGEGLARTRFSKEAAEGKTPREFLLPEVAAPVERACLRALQGESSTVELKGANGRIYLLHSLPVRNDQADIISIIVLAQDITGRKEVERLKDELVSTVSHELRTPLTSMRGFAELLLQRDFPPEQQRKFLSIIIRESVRLARVIDNFLDLQRIASGHQMFQIDPVEILPLVRESVVLFTDNDRQHSLRLVLPEIPLTVLADADRIRQVLMNLLSNAIKYSPAGGEVTVGARQEESEVVFWVADHGIGIPPEWIPKLFQRFSRLDNPLTRHISGTGLGLALVKEIVDAHHGRVWVESEVGTGSTFFFSLPVAET